MLFMELKESNNQQSKIPATSEIHEYEQIRHRRRRMLPRAALIGIAAGAFASLFGQVLAWGDDLRANLLDWSHQYPAAGWLAPMVICALGTAAAVYLVLRFAPETSGSGIPHLKSVLHRFRELSWRRVLPIKFLSGTLALGSGLLLGREGPTVQMGGAVGDLFSEVLNLAPKERRTMIAAGAGAGLAAAFNAPLSGLTFVLEEVQRDFQPVVFTCAFMAAVTANITARFFRGSSPVFSIPSYPTPPLLSLPLFAVLGICAGLLGIVFNRGLILSLNLFSGLNAKGKLLGAGCVGALVGLISWLNPLFTGSGHTLSEEVLAGNLALSAIPLFYLLRLVLTLVSYGTGAAGGIFAPLLVLGALLGLGVGQSANYFFPDLVPIPATFAVVGMAALFTGIVRAPLTGIFLIVEMTGNYNQMLPLLVACFFAYDTADLFKDIPIYEALMERDLLRNGIHAHLRNPSILELEIEEGSPFDRHRVKSLGLPPGCVIASITQDGLEIVPTAQTRLESGMKIAVVIDPEASDSLAILHDGCKAPEV
jgi:CIC family chloride channel protein